MAKKTAPKKRNPQEATTRNVRASHKRDAALDRRLDKVENRLKLALVLINELAQAGLPPERATAIRVELESA